MRHTKLERPSFGHFAKEEWAFLGAPCGIIQKFAESLATRLSNSKIAYVDADHGSFDSPEPDSPFAMQYLDFIKNQQVKKVFDSNPYKTRRAFEAMDAAFVNGNHFQAKRQIVFVHPKKEASLKKRLARITHLDAVILLEGMKSPFSFLKEKMQTDTPIFYECEALEGVLTIMKKRLDKNPPLYGLVLMGGKSQRMGFDKTQIDYHGKPQAQHMADVLSGICEKTFFSTRPNQSLPFSDYEKVDDTFTGLGPYGGILSAFRQQPNAAWLVVASDLPLLDAETLRLLVENRRSSAAATSFRSLKVEKDGSRFPEPLIAIWEPKSYPILLNMLSMGYSCPRKVLINADVHVLEAPNRKALMNVNAPDEYKEVLKSLKS